MVARFVESALTATASAMTLRDVGEYVLPHVERAVHASAALLYRYDDDGRPVAIAGTIAPHLDTYSHHLFDGDPVQRFPRRLDGRPRVVHATRHVDARTYRRSAAYGEFYAVLELEHIVCTWLTHLPYGAPGMTGLLFARPPGREDFDAREHAILARVLPALAATAARAERLRDLDLEKRALEALVGADDGPARLVRSPAGKVLVASPAGERLLGRIGSHALEVLRRALPRAIEPVTVEAQLGGERLAIHLSPVRTPGAEPLVLVEIERPRAENQTTEDLARLHGLTRAESAVLSCMMEGLRNGEAAARLHVSIETVRTHVRRVLDKLGARSRTEAVVLASRPQKAREVYSRSGASRRQVE